VKIINEKYLKILENKNCFKLVNFSRTEFLNFQYQKPLEFFNYFWDIYKKFTRTYKEEKNKLINNQVNGDAFAIIFGFLLEREKVKISKMDEELAKVKFVKPDFLIKKKNKKIIFISLKVSIRERWKQADWESMRFKKIYKNSKTIILMNEKSEINSLKEKIPYISIDYVFHSGSADINNLFKIIKK
jgi:hypothetical protein